VSPRNATEINKRRTYSWRGERFPSVTTLLKGYPQEWAIAFGAKHVAERAMTQEFYDRLQDVAQEPMTAEEGQARISLLRWLKAAPMERRDKAADHGTDVHAYLEFRLKGGTLEEIDSDDPLTPAETAVEQFLATYRPDPLLVESQVFSLQHKYAGSLDAVMAIYGRRLLFDLKTAASYDPMAERPSKAGGDHKDRLQLSAYRYADFIGEDDREVGPVPDVDGAVVLSIPRDHPMQWRLIEVDAGPETFRRFLDFKRAWEWYDANKDEAIGEMVLPQLEGAA
jgi:hypothetical protein